MCYNILRRLGVLAKAKKDVCSLKLKNSKIMEAVAVLLWLIFLLGLVYFAPILDQKWLGWFFVKGPGPGMFSVLITSQGGGLKKYIPNGLNSSYNPTNGKREASETQSPVFNNWYCQHYFKAWGLVYKPLSQKLWECPYEGYGNSTEMPLNETHVQLTPECEIAGLPHDMTTRLTFEQEDLSKFFYLGEVSSTIPIIIGDYDGALRSFTHVKGKEKGADARTIYGIKTEGNEIDRDFSDIVNGPTETNAIRYGRKLTNISISSVKPAASVGALLQEETEAEVRARAKTKEAEGEASKILKEGRARADVILMEAKAEAEREEMLEKAGVTASKRQSIAIERTGLSSLALVPVSPTHETGGGGSAKK